MRQRPVREATIDRLLRSYSDTDLSSPAAHYGETVTIEQPIYMNREDDRCILEISFSR